MQVSRRSRRVRERYDMAARSEVPVLRWPARRPDVERPGAHRAGVHAPCAAACDRGDRRRTLRRVVARDRAAAGDRTDRRADRDARGRIDLQSHPLIRTGALPGARSRGHGFDGGWRTATFRARVIDDTRLFPEQRRRPLEFRPVVASLPVARLVVYRCFRARTHSRRQRRSDASGRARSRALRQADGRGALADAAGANRAAFSIQHPGHRATALSNRSGSRRFDARQYDALPYGGASSDARRRFHARRGGGACRSVSSDPADPHG